jgi:hypothetical protein
MQTPRYLVIITFTRKGDNIRPDYNNKLSTECRTYKEVESWKDDADKDEDKSEKKEMFSASIIAHDASLSEEISEVIKAGIIADESGIRVVYEEEDND